MTAPTPTGPGGTGHDFAGEPGAVSGLDADSLVAAVARHGQQLWLDKLSRSLLDSGELQHWIDAHGVSGLTSNPAIFAQALANDTAYGPALATLRASEPDPERRFEQLAIADIRAACDLLRPTWARSGQSAGYVSFEVSPRLADDGEATLAAARRLWALIDRGNAMIKIPATPQCLGAVTQALAEGICVNVTLIFSRRQAMQVFDACAAGLEKRRAQGLPLGRVRAVASLFVSRVDTMADAALPAHAIALRGQLGVANARAVYADWLDRFGGSAFARLRAAGAHPPRCLWASTGVKSATERDTRYVEALIGPHTINTVPEATLQAFAAHGVVARTLDSDLPGALACLDAAARAGVDLEAMGEQLQAAGLAQFHQAFDRLLDLVR